MVYNFIGNKGSAFPRGTTTEKADSNLSKEFNNSLTFEEAKIDLGMTMKALK